MRARGAACLTGGAFLALSAGCGDEPTVGHPPVYVPNTTVEAVVANLETSLRRREIGEYAGLLHPGFRFVFQAGDVAVVGADFWTRDVDSTRVERLFLAPEVVTLDVSLESPTAPAPFVSLDPRYAGSTFLRIRRTVLEVAQADSVIWRVDGDVQDLILVPGDGAGTDSTRWYLLEWRDLPGNPAFSLPGETVPNITVGRIKALY